MQRSYRLVEITLGGVTGYYAPGSRTTTSHRGLDEVLTSLAPDGVVLDSRAAIESNFELALSSPYVDPYLEPGTITNSHGLSRAQLEPVARACWGSAAAVVMLESSTTFPFTGFDTVSLDWYVEYWRRHGALVGRPGEDGNMVWDGPAAGDSQSTAPLPAQ